MRQMNTTVLMISAVMVGSTFTGAKERVAEVPGVKGLQSRIAQLEVQRIIRDATQKSIRELYPLRDAYPTRVIENELALARKRLAELRPNGSVLTAKAIMRAVEAKIDELEVQRIRLLATHSSKGFVSSVDEQLAGLRKYLAKLETIAKAKP